MEDNYLKLFSCCFATKGFLRSIIVDTQRSEFYFIPNELYEILTEDQGLSFDAIFEKYGKENEKVINEYVSFLLEKDLVFFTKEPKSFPKISKDLQTPRRISNAIIDIDENSIYNINNAIKELDDLDCEGLQIRIFCLKPIEFYYTLTSILNETNQLKTVEIFMPYTVEFVNKKKYSDILRKCLLINCIVIFNSPKTEEIFEEIGSILNFTETFINNESHCGNIAKEYFTTDIVNVVEGVKHNSCLNKKVSIDRFGNIKNCPSMKKTFGQIGKSCLNEILKENEFTDIWRINKDQISICKDCEFRSICVDCRAYLQNPNDIYSKPLKCAYNPYSATWES